MKAHEPKIVGGGRSLLDYQEASRQTQNFKALYQKYTGEKRDLQSNSTAARAQYSESKWTPGRGSSGKKIQARKLP